MSDVSLSKPTTFLVIGAMKSGTTTLTSLLEDHPDVDLPLEKESSAFLSPEAATDAAARFAASTARAVGEVSTGYMQAPIHHSRPELVSEVLGTDVELICMLRDPYERAVSHWRHWHQLGRTSSAPMDQAIQDPDGAYIAFSSYHRQLAGWLEVFGPERVHPFRLEDYTADPGMVTRALWDILRVPHRREDDLQRKQNSGESRVVARGFARRVSRSTFYRRTVRPLLPQGARRLGATTLGGSRGRVEADTSSSTRTRVFDLLADDLAALSQVYPHLTWTPNVEEQD